MFFKDRDEPVVSVAHEVTAASTHRQLLVVAPDGEHAGDLAAIDRHLGDGWTLHFAGDIAAAVAVMDANSIDAVLSFGEGPKSGSGFLEWMRHRYPAVVRLAAVHVDDPHELDVAASDAHQIFTITPDPAEVAQSLSRTVALCGKLGSEDLLEIAGSFKQIPTLPRVYQQVRATMDSADFSIDDIAEIVATDPGLSVRILKIVNSPYYGLRNHVHDLTQAISLLGAPMVSSLVLGVTVQDQFPSSGPVASLIEGEWRRALAVSSVAREFAKRCSMSREDIAMANLGGMLHNVGRLVLLANSWPFDDDEEPATLHELIHLEEERFGLSYPALGGLMLRFWGIDEPVVEAVVFHADPGAAGGSSVSPLAAVHCGVASQPTPELDVDRNYLQRIGVADDFADWVESKRLEAVLDQISL